MRSAIFVLLIFSIGLPTLAQEMNQCQGHLLTVEPGGAISAGTKEALVKAVRSGTPIRVGWSLDFNDDKKSELMHWADAMFLTEFENEIFTQITEINRQAPIRGQGRIDLGEKSLRWSGLLGTNGYVEGRFNDDQPPTRFPVKVQWCIDNRACGASAWRLAYHHENDGRPISGSKEDLFNAVRRGYPIRLAWGSESQKDQAKISVEHSADPVFLTIMNQKELVVQIAEHIGQTSYWDPANAKFDKPQVLWRGMFSTTGEFDAVFVDRATGETVKRIPQRARIAWYVYSPPVGCEASQVLKLAVPEGVILKK